jgi:acetoacetyl-CoA synthetase
VIYAVQSYRHNGKTYDVSEKIALMVSQLPTVERVVIVGAVESDATSADAARSLPEKTLSLEEFLATASGPAPGFRRLPFDHPLFVLFTSGTTGVPKCIEHGAGGTLVQLLKEHVLHCNVGPGSRMLFPTTLGWMMWNWLVTGLASGCTIVLYDGSPAHPSQTALFDMIQRERVTMLGLPGALIEGLRKSGLDLRKHSSS